MEDLSSSLVVAKGGVYGRSLEVNARVEIFVCADL
jgi:hypothetical protein